MLLLITILSCTAVILSLSKDALAATVQLPQSGQTRCYDSYGNEEPCSGTGQDGAKLMGAAWPNPRFSLSGDCVTDNLTGLMWSKDANLPVGTQIWTTAFDWVDALNAGVGLCGYKDWRLPSINELRSLVHSGYKQELCGASSCGLLSYWLNSTGFINVQSDYYWSSTTDATFASGAWCVSMSVGYVGVPPKVIGYYVWPVRGNPVAEPAPVFKTGQISTFHTGDDGTLQRGVAWPAPRFTVNGSTGTVDDNLTGLVWLKNANCFETQAWANALTSANNLAAPQCGLSDGSIAGDWRLPNREELESLVDFAYYSPALSNANVSAKWVEGGPFDNVQSADYWSSTTYAFMTDYEWRVDMDSGSVYPFGNWNSFYVWPVRGGKSGSFSNLVISKTGDGNGTVTGSPAGIACGSNCSALYPHNSVVSLSATPDTGGSIFSGWSGDADCMDGTVVMSSYKACTATFELCQGKPVSVGGLPYDLINEACTAAASTDTIKLVAGNLPEDVTLASGKTIKLEGGYYCDFLTRPSQTTISGSVTISSGEVTIENIIIQ